MKRITQRKLFWFAAIPLLGVGLLLAALPTLLHLLGLHPVYAGKTYQLPGKRALLIATNQAVLGESGKATGVYASELTVPYYQFLDSAVQVDVASIQGGVIPFEPVSLRWTVITPSDQRFLADAHFQDQVTHSLKLAELDFTQYDLIFMAGGWGAAYDLGFSPVLGQKISQAYAANVTLGSVCHGALGFLLATNAQGEPLVKGKRLTAVTDKQVQELGINITPQHPERELRRAGALYESESALLDIFAGHVVVDGNLVTGQNQNDGAEVAQRMLGLVEQKTTK